MSAPAGDGSESFGCGPAARRLPHVLAGSIWLAGLLVAERLDPLGIVQGSRWLKGCLVVLAAAAALWVLRGRAEARTRIVLGSDRLTFVLGARRRELPYDRIERLSWASSLGAARGWLPAAVLRDRQGREWRCSALLRDGARLIERLVERSGRSDLASWSEAHGLARSMGRQRAITAAGYLAATVVVLAGVSFYLH